MKKELLTQKELELRGLVNSIHVAKHEKTCSEENTKGEAEQPFDKEIMGVTHRFNQPSQQKPGTEMGLYQQKHSQLGLKGIEKPDK